MLVKRYSLTAIHVKIKKFPLPPPIFFSFIFFFPVEEKDALFSKLLFFGFSCCILTASSLNGQLLFALLTWCLPGRGQVSIGHLFDWQFAIRLL